MIEKQFARIRQTVNRRVHCFRCWLYYAGGVCPDCHRVLFGGVR